MNSGYPVDAAARACNSGKVRLFRTGSFLFLTGFLIIAIAVISLSSQSPDSASAAEYEYGQTLAVPAQYGTIQAAVDAASNGDTVLVSDGTYSENVNFNGKNITVRSVNGAATTKIQGSGSNNAVITFNHGENSHAVIDGFSIDNQASTSTQTRGISSTSGSAPLVRDCVIEGNSLTISAYNGAGIYVSGATAAIENTVIGTEAHPNSATNGGGVYGTSLTAPLSINNSTISHNTAKAGGGIYVVSAGQPTVITDSTLSHNTATGTNGGAVYSNGSPVTIGASGLSDNHSIQDGGAICMYATSAALTVYGGSSIEDNEGRNGGGIYGWNASSISVSDSRIDSNEASFGGGVYLNAVSGMSYFTNTSISGNTVTYTHGGGIFSNSLLTATDCDINSNSSVQDGGGIYLMGSSVNAYVYGGSVSHNNGRNGAGIYQGAGVNLLVDAVSISSNNTPASIGSGGGIFAGGVTLTVNRSYLRGNRTNQYGGGVYNTGTAVTVTNSMITGNTADQQTYSDGGGIYSAGTLNLVNNTISGNYARRYGGGLRVNSGSTVVENSIIWGNDSGTSGPQISGSPVVNHSNIAGGYSGDGNTDLNPVFVYFLQASKDNPTSSGDFHLGTGSPMVDAASAQYAPVDDIDGDVRPQGGAPDTGADEVRICNSSRPALALSTTNTYWASYSDYSVRKLSVDFNVRNDGTDTAYDVQLNHYTGTAGVVAMEETSISLGDIAGGASKPLTLLYSVPNSVSGFRTTLYISASDSCGGTYDYPGPYPSS